MYKEDLNHTLGLTLSTSGLVLLILANNLLHIYYICLYMTSKWFVHFIFFEVKGLLCCERINWAVLCFMKFKLDSIWSSDLLLRQHNWSSHLLGRRFVLDNNEGHHLEIRPEVWVRLVTAANLISITEYTGPTSLWQFLDGEALKSRITRRWVDNFAFSFNQKPSIIQISSITLNF